MRARDRLRRPARSITFPRFSARPKIGRPAWWRSVSTSLNSACRDRGYLASRVEQSVRLLVPIHSTRTLCERRISPEAHARCAHDCCLVAPRAVGARLPLPTRETATGSTGWPESNLSAGWVFVSATVRDRPDQQSDVQDSRSSLRRRRSASTMAVSRSNSVSDSSSCRRVKTTSAPSGWASTRNGLLVVTPEGKVTS